MRLFQRLFRSKKTQKRKEPQGFQTFILEPILTPSGLVDGPDDIPDMGWVDTDNLTDLDEGIEIDSTPAGEEIPLETSDLPPDFEPVDFITDIDLPQFDDGVFTVDDSGEVGIDFLYDGGAYQGELAIFSLEGMEEFNPGSDEFIQEAARRALSDSELGHVVIHDLSEGARFSGDLPEGNFNAGDYQGVKTVSMRPGDSFGVMLVPNGTVEQVYENPGAEGSVRPLFSMSTLNPDDAFHVGQIADLTGEGNTFAMEDARVDGWTDKDYNDVVFQVKGATGKAVDVNEVINPWMDWRESEVGEEIFDHIEETEAQYPYLTERIWNDADNRLNLLDAFSQSDDPRFGEAIEILETVAIKEEVDLGELETQLSAQIPTLEEALNDPAKQAVLQSLETQIVPFTPGFDAPNEEVAEVFSETADRYGGAGFVGNATGGVVRVGEGYIQTFESGGNDSGAILYGDGYEQGIFLSGEEWQEFQDNGGVATQGYPTEHQLPPTEEGEPIELPGNDLTLPTPDDGEVQALDGTATPQSTPTRTSPIYTNPANGNRYFLLGQDTWSGAQSQARAFGGNLVTINNAAEQSWLLSTFGNHERLWIGLTDSDRYGATEGNFRWVSGEPVTYTNWHPTEPNNMTYRYSPEGEDFVEMNFHASRYSDGRWNDLPVVDGKNKIVRFLGIAEILNRAPIVRTNNQTVYPYQTIVPSFSATDPDGNPISRYAFFDGNTSSSSGYFTVNGVRQAAGRTFTVPASQINSVRFVGGRSPGDDRVYVTASDGYVWSPWRSANINTDTARNTLATARNINLGQTITEYVSENDRDDYYRFRVTQRSRVNLNISGMRSDADLRLLNSAGTVVAASTLGSTRTDSLVRELDPGTYYIRVNRASGRTNYTLRTSAQVVQVNRRPVVRAANQSVRPNQSIRPRFTVTDPNGDAITRYRFYDISDGGGYFTINGVRQPSRRRIEVPASQLNSVRFVGGSTPGSNRVAISAYDGNLWSSWNIFGISTDTADNSRSTARRLSLRTFTQSLRENVSNYDPYDYYQFNLSSRTRVDLGLSRLTGDADVRLLNSAGSTLAYSARRGTSTESLVRDLNPGTYYIRVNRASSNASYNLNYRGTPVSTGPRFTSFSVTDASGDGTSNAVFQRGALRVNWRTNVATASVTAYARHNRTGRTTFLGLVSNGGLINLNSRQLAAGDYNIYLEARDSRNNTGRSGDARMAVLAFNPNNANSIKQGDFTGKTHTFSSGMTQGSVFIGRGGEDVLDFSKSSLRLSDVTFDPNRRAVFGGTTFDWLRVNSTGQEVYFQGYEQLQFANGQVFNLGVKPNDPLFSQQWNLGMMDVPGAWRFTTGNNSVMIGVADSGLQFNNGRLAAADLGQLGTRIVANPNTDIDPVQSSHGTSVQSIIAAQSNNGVGVAGINWNSQVNVSQVFFGGQGLTSVGNSFQELINAAGNRKAILNYSGSSRPVGDANNNYVRKPDEDTALRQVISNNSSNALFIASSGNSFASGSSIKYPTNVVSRPAEFAGSLENAIAVGAIDRNGRRYDYSQYGPELTLLAPSRVPAERIPTKTIEYNGQVYDVESDPRFFPVKARKRSDGRVYTFSGFGGTSAAAPNASGVASLVWSANSTLESSDIKDILTSTANDKFGHYNTNEYGAGIVDAEAAVRRADALRRNGAVAGLYDHNGLFFA